MTAYAPRHAPVRQRAAEPVSPAVAAFRFFRRKIAALLRKRAVPAVAAAGAATTLLSGPYPCCFHCNAGSPCDPRDNHPAPCDDGCNAAEPVLGDQMLGKVRADWDKAYPRPTYYGRHDGDVIVDRRNHVHVRPVNGRSLGDLPRRKPMVNRQPWQTAAMPVYGQAPQLVVEPELARRVIA